MKELTLQEVFNYEEGTIFKMVFENGWTEKVRLEDEDLTIIEGAFEGDDVGSVHPLKEVVEAKYYLLEQWKEVNYYTAYTATGSNIKYVNDDKVIIGSHYFILSMLNSDCSKNGKDISGLLASAKWYIKEEN